MGLDDFRTSASCVAPAPAPTAVTVANCTFRGNVAKLQGGAISQQSGALSIRVHPASTGLSFQAVRPDGVVQIAHVICKTCRAGCEALRPAAGGICTAALDQQRSKPRSQSNLSLCSSGQGLPASGARDRI